MSTRPKIGFQPGAAVILAPYAVQPFDNAAKLSLTTSLDVMNQSMGMTFSSTVT